MFKGRLLALDPGETMGWSCFDAEPIKDQFQLTAYGQLTCNPIAQGIDATTQLFDEWKPDRIVYEDYVVYSWKSASHSWNKLHTPQLIGCIEMLCCQRKLPVSHELAQQAKAFCTDDKLQDWGFYIPGQKHARDSIRHALFYLMFRHTNDR